MVCSRPNSSGGVGGGDDACAGAGSSSSSRSNSGGSTRKGNSSSSSFCALVKNFNMDVHLGTSVRILRHPALPSGCKPSAAASELSVWVTWRDELPERWT